MLFTIITGFVLGFSQLLRPQLFENLVESPRDPESWINPLIVIALGLPAFLGARGAEDWLGVWALNLPETGPDLFTLQYFVLPFIAGEVAGAMAKGVFRFRDLYGFLLPARLKREDAALIEAASLLFGHRVTDAQLQRALLWLLPAASPRAVRAYAAALAGEILSVDDLPLSKMARQMGRTARAEWLSSLCGMGASLRAAGVDELAWLRLIGVGLGLEPTHVRLILGNHGFKAAEPDSWWSRSHAQAKSSRQSGTAGGGFRSRARASGGQNRSRAAHTAPAQDCPWSVLGLAPGADAGAVKSAYRSLAKRYHPDRFATAAPDARAKAEARMKAINAAYDTVKA